VFGDFGACPHNARRMLSNVVLQPSDWLSRQYTHETRVLAWTEPHQARTARGVKHPVYDFLFTYYSFRPSWLRRWHPGPGIAVSGKEADSFLRWPEYRRTARGVELDSSKLRAHRRESVAHIRNLLVTMQQRPPFFSCFGLHEWAMVYQQTPEEIRHNNFPLRFSAEEIRRIVEATPVCCTHYDAFRFFTTPARPLNRYQPTRETVGELEQRGCLHANMDLYKWAFKLSPFTPSELVADCFELARDIREIDMRASPYDLTSLGFPAIAVETVEGRFDYEHHQRQFALRGEPLRARLISLCDWLLDAADPVAPQSNSLHPSLTM